MSAPAAAPAERIAGRPTDGPLRMLATAISLLVVGFAVWMIFRDDHPVAIAIWFFAAAIGHDLIAFPVYSALHVAAYGRATRPQRPPPSDPQAINFLRVPVFQSAIMLLVWFPLILGFSSADLAAKTGNAPDFVARWLLLSAAFFALSALAYVVHLRNAKRAEASA
ncbi:hypothetical protein HJD18_02480 [Thermoleophilia bacterium SCSIO 60948]|nr:hypothetical protein HJD18_02480 [Thermoleophilia bacterium SCSIO 60948]